MTKIQFILFIFIIICVVLVGDQINKARYTHRELETSSMQFPKLPEQQVQQDFDNINESNVQNPIMHFTIADNNKTHILSIGQTFEITLNTPGGYYKYNNPIFNTSLIDLSTYVHDYKKEFAIPGYAGSDTWKFIAVKKGTSEIVISASPYNEITKSKDMFIMTVVIN